MRFLTLQLFYARALKGIYSVFLLNGTFRSLYSFLVVIHMKCSLLFKERERVRVHHVEVLVAEPFPPALELLYVPVVVLIQVLERSRVALIETLILVPVLVLKILLQHLLLFLVLLNHMLDLVVGKLVIFALHAGFKYTFD